MSQPQSSTAGVLVHASLPACLPTANLLRYAVMMDDDPRRPSASVSHDRPRSPGYLNPNLLLIRPSSAIPSPAFLSPSADLSRPLPRFAAPSALFRNSLPPRKKKYPATPLGCLPYIAIRCLPLRIGVTLALRVLTHRSRLAMSSRSTAFRRSFRNKTSVICTAMTHPPEALNSLPPCPPGPFVRHCAT